MRKILLIILAIGFVLSGCSPMMHAALFETVYYTHTVEQTQYIIAVEVDLTTYSIDQENGKSILQCPNNNFKLEGVETKTSETIHKTVSFGTICRSENSDAFWLSLFPPTPAPATSVP